MTSKPGARISTAIDHLNRVVAGVSSMFLVLLMLTIVVNVLLRYVFSIGMIELEELQWHLNAVVVMGCLAYAYQTDQHVRVDVLRVQMSARKQSILEALGIIFLLIPFITLVAYHAFHILSYSWQLREGSPMPSGLPARYLVKGVMFAGLCLLILQAVSAFLKAMITIFMKPIDDENS